MTEQQLHTEEMILNMGPQHPATHGVLRVIMTLDGETIVNAEPVVGYLHRGKEKHGEDLTYTQFITFTDRLDYVSSMANNLGWCLAVETLCGLKTTPRCDYLRVIIAELTRIASQLLNVEVVWGRAESQPIDGYGVALAKALAKRSSFRSG